MSNYKEIVTKAVIGKGRKTTKNNFEVQTEEIPNTVLGCWIINHRFTGSNKGNEVTVNGSYDVNVWYSYDNDTKTTVSTKRMNYEDEMVLRTKPNTDQSNTDIIVRSLKQPTVTNVKIEDGIVKLDIEKELGVEIVGDDKFRVMTDEIEEDWEELDDLDTEEIDENYIK